MTSQNTDEIDLREIVSLLRRQLRLIVITVAIGLGLAAIFLVRATPLYTSSALVLVDPAQKNLLLSDDLLNPNASSANALIESEVEILKSDATILATIEAAQLLADPEFGPRLGLLAKILQAVGIGSDQAQDGQALVNATLSKLKDAIEVRRRGLTYIISVSATSQSPQRAADLANILTKTYIRRQIEAKVTSSLAARDVLQGQLSTAQQALARSETALSDFIDNNIERLARESGSQRVEELRLAFQQIEANRLSAQIAVEAAEGALGAQDWDALTQVLQSDALEALQAQRQTLARQLGQLAEGSQEQIDLRASLSQIENKIRQEGTTELLSLRQDVSEYYAFGDQAREDIRRELLAAELSAETVSQIYGLQQDAAITQRQYDTLLTRMRDLEAQALVQVADSRVVSQALAPSLASFPKKKLVLALALLASLGLGIGFAFLNEYYVGGINSISQLANIIPAKVGTLVPRLTPSTEQLSVADTVLDQPMSLFAESFRRLRAAIDRSIGAELPDGMVVMVTSSIPAEGKSVTALSLARTYAAAGKKTLLIDADMRKPTLHKFLGLEPKAGLLDFLQYPKEYQELDSFYVSDRADGLSVILGQRRSDIPTDQLLQSRTFAEFVANAKSIFEVVVIDTPPLIPVVDARYVAPLADCIVLCARFAEASQTDLRAAYDQLIDSTSSDIPVVTILNFNEGKESGYRYSGYYGYNIDD